MGANKSDAVAGKKEANNAVKSKIAAVNEQPLAKTFKIVNRLGMHARAAALFVRTSSKFESEIFVTKGKNRVNGKSIMGLLMLAAAQGAAVKIEIQGPDQDVAMKKIGMLIEKGFNEKD